MMSAWQIRVRGLVQGVGFRPHVWHVAQAEGITGTVCNDNNGVLIEAWGTHPQFTTFVTRLQAELPPLARIDQLEHQLMPNETSAAPPHDFRIISSHGGEVHTGIVPDAHLCAACNAEVFDPNNRRYRYPFTNCTHCGPRLSIVQGIPYDRTNTSMAAFALCPACEQEYRNPADRRFHAQPNACPVCGPQYWLESNDGESIPTTAPARDCLDTATLLLRQGKILAVMGLGGVHLVCDATNAAAIDVLRQRKRRYQKPLALMARDLVVVRRYCHVNDAEAALLHSTAAPIVLLANHTTGETHALPPQIGMAQGKQLGFMLPYTPLHALLLETWDTPLVMTSANLSEEPQCINLTETRERVRDIADYFLLHNRPIVNRVDDSVARVIGGKPRLLRRARGYAPAPLALPSSFHAAPPLLAMGGELKNTFALLRDGQVTLSQHLGDLEDARTWREYTRTLQLYRELFAHTPQAIVVDKHPAYRSTQGGQQLARELAVPLIEVQHHHAHLAACLAENGWELHDGKVLGIVLDGLGYGDDGTLWGGELLLADYVSAERVGHFKPVAMPGGTQAILQPWRNLWAQLHSAGWDALAAQFGELDVWQFLQQQPLATLQTMLQKGLNSPLSSSCGRLFDAVAAALDCSRASIQYEGQAAIELEAITPACLLHLVPPYPFAVQTNPAGLLEIDPAPMWWALLHDLQSGYDRATVAAHFHQGLLQVLVDACALLAAQHALKTVVLSGGVLQNVLLFTHLQARLQARGLTVLTHSQVPTNDGGLSLGQAAIAAAQWLQSPAT
ncbi:MAG: carbamoyltransferase HypF [Pseudomonadota bacterium]